MCCNTTSRKQTKLSHSVHRLSKSTMNQYRSIHNCCFKGSSLQELGMTIWKRSSNSNFAELYPPAIRSQIFYEACYKPALADAIWAFMPKEVVGPTRQSQYALDGGSLVHRIPWQRGTTYNDICRLYTNYVTRRYGHAIIVFDGYQEELSTKYGAHERRTGGRTGPKVDFTRNMVMKSKKKTSYPTRTTSSDSLGCYVKYWNTLDAKHVIPRVMQMS